MRRRHDRNQILRYGQLSAAPDGRQRRVRQDRGHLGRMDPSAHGHRHPPHRQRRDHLADGRAGGQGRDRRRGHRPRGDRAGAGHDGHRRFRDPLDELLHPAGDRREKRDVHRRQLRLRGVRLRGGHGAALSRHRRRRRHGARREHGDALPPHQLRRPQHLRALRRRRGRLRDQGGGKRHVRRDGRRGRLRLRADVLQEPAARLPLDHQSARAG